MSEKPSYFQQVYAITAKIPRGKITTYGAIANFLDLGSARMVGWALNKSFGSEKAIPAHRVVNRNGELSGRNHFPTSTMMQELLEQEGVIIEHNKVKHFTKHFWNPSEQL